MKYFIFALAIFVVSCNPCKRLQRKCPPVMHDSIVYRETIRDSIVKVQLPGDTTVIEIPAVTLTDMGLVAENENQKITARVSNGVFHLQSICKEDSLELVIHGLRERLSQKVTTIKVPEPYAEKYIPKIYKHILIYAIILTVLVAIIIYLKVKGGALKFLRNS